MVHCVDMKSEDLNKAPKLFCESITIGQSPEYFALGLSSGSQSHIFTITPAHAKRLMQYLTYEVTEYEKKNGTLNTYWEPHVVSPVQRVNPPSDNS